MKRSHSKTTDYVWKYLEGELSGEAMKIFEDDLKTDPELNQIYLSQKEIYEALEKTETIELRKQLSGIMTSDAVESPKRLPGNSYRMMWYLAAASVVIIFCLGYIIIKLSVNGEDPGIKQTERMAAQQKNDSNLRPEKEKLNDHNEVKNLAADASEYYFQKDTNGLFDHAQGSEEIYQELLAILYQENPMLEGMIDMNYRSELINLYLPEPNRVFRLGDEVVFYWKPEIQTKIFLTITNNRSIIVFQALLKGRQLIIDQSFSPGLYYWKINTEQENLFYGKFSVIE